MPEKTEPPRDARCRELVERLTEPVREELTARQNVKGTAIGLRTREGKTLDELALIVYVSEKVSEQDLPWGACIPSEVEIDGETIQTDVREVGIPTGDAGSPTRKEAIRPVLGGTQVGTSDDAGTTTALFYTRSGEQRILTSRHAITTGSDTIGRDVRQPQSGEIIGSVVATHEFSTSGTRRNILDTAVIEPNDDVDVSGIYLGWNEADDTGRSYLGDRVVAFSAGGGIAGGTVLARGVDISLTLVNGESARYGQLVEYDWDGAAGASGAAVGIVDPRTRELTIVGQHIGSSSSVSWMVPWVTIEREFGVLTPASGRGPQPVDDSERQDGNATIVVEDAAGNPIQGATVTVRSSETITSSATIVVEDSAGNPIEGATVNVNPTN